MEKILTISIAAYNDEKYIRETLESLLCKDVINQIEILVCDDGGTDSTLDIVRDYSRKYPDSVFSVHKENGGYGSVINTTARMAKGKYFKQLDGDDWFVTENLSSFVKLLESTDADCVFTSMILRQEGKQTTEKIDNFNYMKEGCYQFQNTQFKRVTSMYGTTFRTEILQKMDLQITEHCFYTDIEYINLPLPYVETFYVSHLPIYIYRLGIEGQSMSIEGVRKHYKDHEKVFWRLAKLHESMGTDMKSKRQLLMIRLRKEFTAHLKFYCMLPKSKDAFNEMKFFSQSVKRRYPEIFKQAYEHHRFAKLLITTKYLSYPIMSFFIK